MAAGAADTGLRASARLFDGKTAQPRDVVIGIGESALVLLNEQGTAIEHWPLASLKAVRGGSGEAVQLSPDAEAIERLVVTDDQMIRAIRQRCPGLERRRTNRNNLGKATLWAVGAVASVLLILFVLVPMLSEQLAEVIPPEREQALGDAVADQLTSLLSTLGDEETPFCEEAEGTAALAKMRDRLMDGVALPYPLRLGVLDSPLVNAVAVPGGRVILFRGLIDQATSPEEVAGVLAHEIGHVFHRDPVREAMRAAGTAGIIGLMLGDVVGAGALVVATEAVMNAQYRQEAEARADEFAVTVLAKANLPSAPFARFFQAMKEQYGASEGVFRYIASHPDLAGRAERAAAADRIGDGPFKPVIDDDEWAALRAICD